MFVMHNICLLRGDEIELNEINETEDNNLHQDVAPFEQTDVAKRNLICETLPMRCV